jgi:hypothetical protein
MNGLLMSALRRYYYTEQTEGDQWGREMWHTMEKPYRKETTWKTYTNMDGGGGTQWTGF